MRVDVIALRLRKSVRRYIARPALQQPFRLLYRIALAGMNYGGAGSMYSAGDEIALERLVANRPTGRVPVIFDVGANVGAYVKQALDHVPDARVYAFEPSRAAFTRLHDLHGTKPNVTLVKAGVGAKATTATLWSAVPGSVLASTYQNPDDGELAGEAIDLVTLDEFCERERVDYIDLLKLDVEGAELDALRGATRLLAQRAIGMIQFEFGQPSLGARTFFADLFRLLDEGYEIFRVLPRGLERLARYHETLEVFMSTNYLAVARAR